MTGLQVTVRVRDVSGSRPWLLGRREDLWLSVSAFRRVWLCRCYLLSIVDEWRICLIATAICHFLSYPQCPLRVISGRRRPILKMTELRLNMHGKMGPTENFGCLGCQFPLIRF